MQWAKHQNRWFGKWHTYIGIFAGIIVAFIGLTGSILVFQDEIDEALNPKLFQTFHATPKLGFNDIASIVKEKYPKQRIVSISSAKNGNVTTAYKVLLSANGIQGNETETFINPYTGEISGKRIYKSSFIRIITDLHVHLMLSLPGRIFVGISTLVLLILTISGLRLWIPAKWKQLRSVLTIKFSSGFKRQNYDWHNVIGFYTAPFVIVLCVTGFCMNLGILAAPVLMKISGENTEVINKLLATKSQYTKGIPRLPINHILASAKREMPEARVTTLVFPSDSTGTFALQMLGQGKIALAKRDVLLIDQYSGKILFNNRKELQEIGKAYLGWLKPLHYGNFGGLPTKLLAFLGGISPLALMITGFITWWPRFKKKRKKSSPISRNKNIRKEPVPEQSWRKIFSGAFKKGTKYAIWMVFFSLATGALYGLSAGILIEPSLLTLYLFVSIVLLNFTVATLVLVAALVSKTLLLVKMNVNIRGAVRYFALSLSFLLIFTASFYLATRLEITSF